MGNVIAPAVGKAGFCLKVMDGAKCQPNLRVPLESEMAAASFSAAWGTTEARDEH